MTKLLWKPAKKRSDTHCVGGMSWMGSLRNLSLNEAWMHANMIPGVHSFAGFRTDNSLRVGIGVEMTMNNSLL